MVSVLNEFAFSSEIFSLIAESDCGWLDGACFIFARALEIWLDGKIVCLVRDCQIPEHFVLKVGDWYVDAEGARCEAELLRSVDRWQCAYALRTLDDLTQVGIDTADILRDEIVSQHLAAALEKHFGHPETQDLGLVLNGNRRRR